MYGHTYHQCHGGIITWEPTNLVGQELKNQSFLEPTNVEGGFFGAAVNVYHGLMYPNGWIVHRWNPGIDFDNKRSMLNQPYLRANRKPFMLERVRTKNAWPIYQPLALL